MTLGPWLAILRTVPLPTLTLAMLEMSRHTTVGSCAVVFARASRTRASVEAAGTDGTVQVTVPPDSRAVPLAARAAVNDMPRDGGTVTDTLSTGTLLLLVSRIRDG